MSANAKARFLLRVNVLTPARMNAMAECSWHFSASHELHQQRSHFWFNLYYGRGLPYWNHSHVMKPKVRLLCEHVLPSNLTAQHANTGHSIYTNMAVYSPSFKPYNKNTVRHSTIYIYIPMYAHYCIIYTRALYYMFRRSWATIRYTHTSTKHRPLVV